MTAQTSDVQIKQCGMRRIVLLHSSDRLLPEMSASLGAFTLKKMEQHGFEVVGEAGDGQEAIATAARLRPDLILLDLLLTGMDGVETTRRVMATTPCAILLVTGTPESVGPPGNGTAIVAWVPVDEGSS